MIHIIMLIEEIRKLIFVRLQFYIIQFKFNNFNTTIYKKNNGNIRLY